VACGESFGENDSYLCSDSTLSVQKVVDSAL